MEVSQVAGEQSGRPGSGSFGDGRGCSWEPATEVFRGGPGSAEKSWERLGSRRSGKKMLRGQAKRGARSIVSSPHLLSFRLAPCHTTCFFPGSCMLREFPSSGEPTAPWLYLRKIWCRDLVYLFWAYLCYHPYSVLKDRPSIWQRFK